jgi:hypothetical protein
MSAVGVKLLVEKYRKVFRIPENTQFYSDCDYRKAEKKFLKYCLTVGPALKSEGTVPIESKKP